MIADLVTRMDFYADMLKANTFTRNGLVSVPSSPRSRERYQRRRWSDRRRE
jgi:hypothetical protein